MKGIESGKDKVKKICEVLRKETLEPAQREGEELLQKAKVEAERITNQAKREADAMIADAKKEIERQKNVFQSSLSQGCKQALESLKQDIEEKLFNKELSKLITKQTQDTRVIAELISAVVHAIEKQGIDSDISGYVTSAVPARTINTLLAKEIVERLKEKSVLVGPMAGGIEVKLHKDNITLDLTDEALKELVATYVRKDFRELLFGSL